jgi:hypothetical protein
VADELGEELAGDEEARVEHRGAHNEAKARGMGPAGFVALEDEVVGEEMDEAAQGAPRQVLRRVGPVGARDRFHCIGHDGFPSLSS